MARILIIEDDEKIREMLRFALESRGHEVVEAENGKIGIDLQKKESFKLIITDLIMPEKDGLELIAELRPDYPELKIIAISGDSRLNTKGYLQTAQKIGADKTFPKPLNVKEILRAVKELCA